MWRSYQSRDLGSQRASLERRKEDHQDKRKENQQASVPKDLNIDEFGDMDSDDDDAGGADRYSPVPFGFLRDDDVVKEDRNLFSPLKSRYSTQSSALFHDRDNREPSVKPRVEPWATQSVATSWATLKPADKQPRNSAAAVSDDTGSTSRGDRPRTRTDDGVTKRRDDRPPPPRPKDEPWASQSSKPAEKYSRNRSTATRDDRDTKSRSNRAPPPRPRGEPQASQSSKTPDKQSRNSPVGRYNGRSSDPQPARVERSLLDRSPLQYTSFKELLVDGTGPCSTNQSPIQRGAVGDCPAPFTSMNKASGEIARASSLGQTPTHGSLFPNNQLQNLPRALTLQQAPRAAGNMENTDIQLMKAQLLAASQLLGINPYGIQPQVTSTSALPTANFGLDTLPPQRDPFIKPSTGLSGMPSSTSQGFGGMPQLHHGDNIGVINTSVPPPITIKRKPVPDGSGSHRYPPPDVNSFTFDPTIGLKFDHTTGLHYEANSGYYLNSNLKIFLRWDAFTQTYLQVENTAGLQIPQALLRNSSNLNSSLPADPLSQTRFTPSNVMPSSQTPGFANPDQRAQTVLYPIGIDNSQLPQELELSNFHPQQRSNLPQSSQGPSFLSQSSLNSVPQSSERSLFPSQGASNSVPQSSLRPLFPNQNSLSRVHQPPPKPLFPSQRGLNSAPQSSLRPLLPSQSGMNSAPQSSLRPLFPSQSSSNRVLLPTPRPLFPSQSSSISMPQPSLRPLFPNQSSWNTVPQPSQRTLIPSHSGLNTVLESSSGPLVPSQTSSVRQLTQVPILSDNELDILSAESKNKVARQDHSNVPNFRQVIQPNKEQKVLSMKEILEKSIKQRSRESEVSIEEQKRKIEQRREEVKRNLEDVEKLLDSRREEVSVDMSKRKVDNRRLSRSPGRRSNQSPNRRQTRSPVRRDKSSPVRRRGNSPSSRSKTPTHGQNRSPIRRRSRSPLRKKSRSPVNRRGRSPVNRQDRCPVNRHDRSPVSRQGRSPVDRQGRSPVNRQERSPVNRHIRGPVNRHSRSPVNRQGRSPVNRQGRSPVNRQGRSPVNRQGRSPVNRHGRSPVNRHGRSPVNRPGRSHVHRQGKSPVHRLGRSPIGRNSRTCDVRSKSNDRRISQHQSANDKQPIHSRRTSRGRRHSSTSRSSISPHRRSQQEKSDDHDVKSSRKSEEKDSKGLPLANRREANSKNSERDADALKNKILNNRRRIQRIKIEVEPKEVPLGGSASQQIDGEGNSIEEKCGRKNSRLVSERKFVSSSLTAQPMQVKKTVVTERDQSCERRRDRKKKQLEPVGSSQCHAKKVDGKDPLEASARVSDLDTSENIPLKVLVVDEYLVSSEDEDIDGIPVGNIDGIPVDSRDPDELYTSVDQVAGFDSNPTVHTEKTPANDGIQEVATASVGVAGQCDSNSSDPSKGWIKEQSEAEKSEPNAGVSQQSPNPHKDVATNVPSDRTINQGQGTEPSVLNEDWKDDETINEELDYDETMSLEVQSHKDEEEDEWTILDEIEGVADEPVQHVDHVESTEVIMYDEVSKENTLKGGYPESVKTSSTDKASRNTHQSDPKITGGQEPIGLEETTSMIGSDATKDGSVGEDLLAGRSVEAGKEDLSKKPIEVEAEDVPTKIPVEAGKELPAEKTIKPGDVPDKRPVRERPAGRPTKAEDVHAGNPTKTDCEDLSTEMSTKADSEDLSTEMSIKADVEDLPTERSTDTSKTGIFNPSGDDGSKAVAESVGKEKIGTMAKGNTGPEPKLAGSNSVQEPDRNISLDVPISCELSSEKDLPKESVEEIERRLLICSQQAVEEIAVPSKEKGQSVAVPSTSRSCGVFSRLGSQKNETVDEAAGCPTVEVFKDEPRFADLFREAPPGEVIILAPICKPDNAKKNEHHDPKVWQALTKVLKINKLGPNMMIQLYSSYGTGAPYDYSLLTFKNAGMAQQWYVKNKDVATGVVKIVLHHEVRPGVPNTTPSFGYFSVPNWSCKSCRLSNFPVRSLCHKCGAHKDNGYTPVSVSLNPTRWLGIFKLPFGATQDFVLARFPAKTKLNYQSLTMIVDPAMDSYCGICVFQMSSIPKAKALQNAIPTFFRHVSFVLMNDKSDSFQGQSGSLAGPVKRPLPRHTLSPHQVVASGPQLSAERGDARGQPLLKKRHLLGGLKGQELHQQRLPQPGQRLSRERLPSAGQHLSPWSHPPELEQSVQLPGSSRGRQAQRQGGSSHRLSHQQPYTDDCSEDFYAGPPSPEQSPLRCFDEFPDDDYVQHEDRSYEQVVIANRLVQDYLPSRYSRSPEHMQYSRSPEHRGYSRSSECRRYSRSPQRQRYSSSSDHGRYERSSECRRYDYEDEARPQKPDGNQRYRYPPPDPSQFLYERHSKMDYDPETTLYFDRKLELFYNDDLKIYLDYNNKTGRFTEVFL